MIYECPNCHAPQEAGQTSCPDCGAEFDGPVPDDAILPASAAPGDSTAAAQPAEAVLDTPAAEPLPPVEPARDSVPESFAPESFAPEEITPEEPRLETVRPPAEALPPTLGTYQPPPYIPPPAYAPPPAAVGGAQAYTARKTPSGTLPKALLIAAPIVLVLVVGGLLYSRTLDGGSDAAPPAPLPVSRAFAPPPRPAATPVGSPTVLPGGTTAAAADPRVQWLGGRWEAKNSDFYVFNPNGSGSQGSATGKLPARSFLWRIVQNQLVLYGTAKDQQLRFGVGPDDNTVYLSDGTDKPLQFTRDTASTPKQ